MLYKILFLIVIVNCRKKMFVQIYIYIFRERLVYPLYSNLKKKKKEEEEIEISIRTSESRLNIYIERNIRLFRISLSRMIDNVT